MILCCQKLIIYIYYLRIVKGFSDTDGTKEFLFALPRFAQDIVSNKNVFIYSLS